MLLHPQVFADLETDMSYKAAEAQGVYGLPFATQTRSLEFFLSTACISSGVIRSLHLLIRF